MAQGGDDETATWWLARLRMASPKDGRLAKQLGEQWLRLGVPGQAARELDAALDLVPWVDRSQRGPIRVVQSTRGGLPEDERRQGVAEIHVALADAKQQLGQLDAAARHQAQSLALHARPTATQWLELARLWAQAGATHDARHAACTAARTDPQDAAAHLACAQTSARVGQKEAAFAHARSAWTLDPNEPAALVLMGELLLARDEAREARRYLEAGLTLHTGHAQLQELLSRARRMGG
jgi:Flp pilus assembly protein TadD